MPLKKVTKEEILLKSLDVFRVKGYHNTAMSDLAEACGLQKGSFYHYFDSKETLMKEVLLVSEKYLNEKVFTIIDDEKLLPREKMDKVLKKLSKTLLMKKGGCIIGNMTMETALNIPDFKTILMRVFDGWILAMQKIYETKYTSERAFKLAELTVMEFEGAVLLTKIYGGERYFVETYQRVMGRL